jgi:hypothetical protein
VCGCRVRPMGPARLLKLAPFSPTLASVFNRSRVLRPHYPMVISVSIPA